MANEPVLTLVGNLTAGDTRPTCPICGISAIVRGIKWATAGGPIQTERKYFRG